MSVLWGLVRNPPLEWVDDAGVVVESYRVSRTERWAITQPLWVSTILTTRPECGCRRRFGLWHTLYCSDHAFGPRTT